jgi:hypothetical protein
LKQLIARETSGDEVVAARDAAVYREHGNATAAEPARHDRCSSPVDHFRPSAITASGWL